MKLTDLEDYSKLENRFDQLENKIDSRFNQLEARINGLQGEFTVRINGLQVEFNSIKTLIWLPVVAAVAQIIVAFLK